MEFISFLDEHDGFFMALLTFVYVVFTIFIFIANNKSVKEMKITREEESRPYIVSYIYSKPRGTAELVIQNIGKTMAKDIEIRFSPDFDFPKKRPLSKSNILNNTIPSMPPNYEIKMFAGMNWDFKDEDGAFPVYEIKIKYHSSSGKTYTDHYIIDLNVESGATYLVEKDVHDLTKEFIVFRKKFDKLQGDISYIKNTYKSDDRN